MKTRLPALALLVTGTAWAVNWIAVSESSMQTIRKAFPLLVLSVKCGLSTTSKGEIRMAGCLLDNG